MKEVSCQQHLPSTSLLKQTSCRYFSTDAPSTVHETSCASVFCDACSNRTTSESLPINISTFSWKVVDPLPKLVKMLRFGKGSCLFFLISGQVLRYCRKDSLPNLVKMPGFGKLSFPGKTAAIAQHSCSMSLWLSSPYV